MGLCSTIVDYIFYSKDLVGLSINELIKLLNISILIKFGSL